VEEGKRWIETNQDSQNLIEADFTGFGFALIERQVLEAVSSPRFSNVWVPEWKTYSIEDRSFCHKAQEAGYTIWVDQPCSKRVYHVGSWAYSYDNDFKAYQRLPLAERILEATPEQAAIIGMEKKYEDGWTLQKDLQAAAEITNKPDINSQ
jgi:hypothetical protein